MGETAFVCSCQDSLYNDASEKFLCVHSLNPSARWQSRSDRAHRGRCLGILLVFDMQTSIRPSPALMWLDIAFSDYTPHTHTHTHTHMSACVDHAAEALAKRVNCCALSQGF